jgi:hypothetical protein
MLAEASDKTPVERYTFPDSIESKLYIKSNTNSSVTFRLEVKSVMGTIKSVNLSAKVSGFNQVIAIPSEAKFDEIKEGESQYLDFILPTTKEIANSSAFKIRGLIQYLPDYNAIKKYVEANAESKYENEVMRDMLMVDIKDCDDQSLKSVESIRYFPPKK